MIMYELDIIFAVSSVMIFGIMGVYTYKLIKQKSYLTGLITLSYSIIFAGYIYVLY